MSNLMNRRSLLWLAPVIIAAAAGLGTASMLQPPPADLDLSLRKATEGGLYIASLVPDLTPIVLGTMHGWTIDVTTPDGKPVKHADISIDGGMPQHGHGLPTLPQVTGELGGGRYQIEGMKFNMPGWWTVEVSVKGPAGADTVTFNLML